MSFHHNEEGEEKGGGGVEERPAPDTFSVGWATASRLPGRAGALKQVLTCSSASSLLSAA